MLFNSFEFAWFFVAVVCGYFLLPYRLRWIWLLVASYWFYMAWNARYGLLLMVSTAVDYAVALWIARSSGPRRRALLAVSLGMNLGLLFFFKYYNFIAGSLVSVGASLPLSSFLLPVGISFYTFQTLSYTVDVYRGQEPERHLGRFALYVAYFPQLVAGPIERSSRLLPQLRQQFDFSYARATSGLRLMAWGFFLKLVIADRLAGMVDRVYGTPGVHTGPALVLATMAFGFQIFGDFGGYSYIAIGAARVMGVELMVNFRQPYHAVSLQDFWRRWHISLSTWFRDYVYVPMGGNKAGRLRFLFAVTSVFVLSGIWHGANWTFLAWGALHAVLFVGGVLTRRFRDGVAASIGLTRVPRLRQALAVASTFALVSLTWVFFRASSIAEAGLVLSRLDVGWRNLVTSQGPSMLWSELGLRDYELSTTVMSLCVLEAVESARANGSIGETLYRYPRWVRVGAYSGLVWWIVFFGYFRELPFIYFRF